MCRFERDRERLSERSYDIYATSRHGALVLINDYSYEYEKSILRLSCNTLRDASNESQSHVINYYFSSSRRRLQI